MHHEFKQQGKNLNTVEILAIKVINSKMKEILSKRHHTSKNPLVRPFLNFNWAIIVQTFYFGLGLI